ncbi:hypothetical protein PGT21_029188 [Puccinia graminis f. sp. tritici]|uniref:Mediator of RNA polymerase II transcription subunit 11 n=1 Tax=Puccinia graminis f. sp. tritici TaxID=56615 RepID=A0A5B0QM15_PUCGR|nr:hypothetical protein PGT21_029188 [Puccinia graminis f. sp. tritici]KAA1113914.1 hypothetical protein PGTUg99_015748 [Puccinia graminis f. sp. tritici]
MSSPDSSSSSASSDSSSSIAFDPNTLTQQPTQAELPAATNPELLFNNPLPSSLNPTIESNSQSTAFTLSGFTNNNLQHSQNTDLTSLANTQSTTNNPSQPISKTSHPTAPSRGWMSQRKGKAIHIDDDHPSLRTELNGEFESDQSEQTITSTSSQRILELGIVEEQLSQLLNLASDALGSLGPSLDQNESTNTATETFSSSIHQYFELLNKIQLGLRTSMSHLRVSRVSTRILFEPAHVSIPNCPVGLGDLKLMANPTFNQNTLNHPFNKEGQEAGSSTLSLGSLVAERNAWQDLVESLEFIKAQRTGL